MTLVADFDFDLPETLIAQEPPARREDARLLVLPRSGGDIVHTTFAHVADHLHSGDLLVLNNTKVFPARLLGRRVPSGGAVECLLMGRLEEPQLWDALVHPGQKLRPGSRVVFEHEGTSLHGEILDRRFHGRRTVRLWSESQLDVDAIVDRIGHVPLPPYIKREDRITDRERYQTVFATERGSVAAPTAGLHFTDDLLASLAARGVERAEVTLHVGYGTFKPVRVDRVEDHDVDPETFTVPRDTVAAIVRAHQQGRRVIAVGTTTVRALESLVVADDGHVSAASGQTRLFIRPGHQFHVVNGLITNFHLPRSSLLMLVAAFAGRERVLAAYREAIERQYRFYSYGDAMLIV